VVVNGKEQVVYGENPWDVLGFEAAEQAFTLFDAGDFAAAARLLETAKRKAEAVHVTRALAAAEAISAGFAAWDRFDHKVAHARLQDTVKGSHDLAWFLGEERAAAIRSDVEGWLAGIPAVTGEPHPSRALLIDLLANARRRCRELRFDDAAARLYRAVELMAQVRLMDYRIDTKRIPLDQIPEGCRPEFLAVAHNGVVTCGLQAAYQLLICLGDEMGAAFAKLVPQGRGSHLEMRNNSILAHGFQPVGEAGCRKLWDMVMRLALIMGITENELPEFPKLGGDLG
jgi:CRISPR-associated protein (TIGR02710 family)